jgi:hypothetical protein
MLNPTQETARQIDEEVVAPALSDEEHVSPDRSIVGPYTVEMPEPRD